VQATGLTYGTIVQIERAREAVTVLKRGASIADAIYQVGYYDQPHLTRSLKRFVGKTPAQIAHDLKSE
jgi:AraC-like DNA-binding protein